MSFEEQVMHVTVGWIWQKQIKCAFHEMTNFSQFFDDFILSIMVVVLVRIHITLERLGIEKINFNIV